MVVNLDRVQANVTLREQRDTSVNTNDLQHRLKIGLDLVDVADQTSFSGHVLLFLPGENTYLMGRDAYLGPPLVGVGPS